jgi:hypothetical protein
MRHLQLLGLADGEAEEHGIARHVGGEDPAQSQIAQGIHAARDKGEGQEYPVPPPTPSFESAAARLGIVSLRSSG